MPSMPPRLNKRQAREVIDLGKLSENRDGFIVAGESDSDEDLVSQRAPLPTASAFAKLALESEDNDVEDAAEDIVPAQAEHRQDSPNRKKKTKTKKRGAKTKFQDTNSSDLGSTQFTATANKARLNTGTRNDVDSGFDEIDLAIAELAVSKTQLGCPPSQSFVMRDEEVARQKIKLIYSIETKHLNPDTELRRMFGSKVVQDTSMTRRSPHHARLSNNPHHSTSIARLPSLLASPEYDWPTPSKAVTLKRYHGTESSSDIAADWWTYEHTVNYKQAQLLFLEILQQAEGNKLFDVLQVEPYHIDTLLQLSEMMVQQGDLGAASSFLSKALYALSVPLPPSIMSGTFRLPYSKVENRAFYLAIGARKIPILVKRGTWRTACEWAKIVLSAGGDSDPVGTLLHVDLIAVKAKQYAWLLDLLGVLPVVYPNMHIEYYPGLAFAKALSMHGMENIAHKDHEPSNKLLLSAILRFPCVIPLLYTSLGLKVEKEFLDHRRAQVDAAFSTKPSYLTSLLAQIYVARSSPVWKEPPLSAWLQSVASSASSLLDERTMEDVVFGEKIWHRGSWPLGKAPYGVIRGAFISDIASVRPLLPPDVLTRTSYSYDPVPPI